MKLLKPGWIHLDGRQIFSVDIDPRGRFIAVGGQGDNNCGKISVFNFEHFAKFCPNVKAGAIGDEETLPKKLCEMNNHLGCVNCVRWSPDGKYLASGSDDSLIMIWQPVYSKGIPSSNGVPNRYPDQCRCICMLREHTGDVLDLAWNRDGSLLASCSIDNSIIVWNALKFPIAEKVAVLKKHSGLVKGVCFDPAGTYLASQADDKTLIVWRTSDWSVETKISEPFKQCSGTTHVLRLSWSPDGQTLVTAHAMNSGGPTAQLVNRGPPWTANIDLAGHRRAVTSCRFHNRLFVNASAPLQQSQNGADTHEKNPEPFCAVAIGSRDRSVSVWLTNLRRPRMVLQDVFSDSVLDLAWFGYCLFACSVDGSVSCVIFTESEIGKMVSDKEVVAHLNATRENKDSKKAEKVIIQSAALLADRKKQTTIDQHLLPKGNKPEKKQEPIPDSNQNDNQPVSTSALHRPTFLTSNSQSPFPTAAAFPTAEIAASPSNSQMAQQTEVKLPNGRRRITPMVIPVEPMSPNGFSLFENLSNFSKPAPPASGTPVAPSSIASVVNSEAKKSEGGIEQTPEVAAKKPEDGDVIKVSASRFVGAKPGVDELKASAAKAKKSLIGGKRKATRSSLPGKIGGKRQLRVESSSDADSDDSNVDEEVSEKRPQTPQKKSLSSTNLFSHHYSSALHPSRLHNPAGKNSITIHPSPGAALSSKKNFIITVQPMDDHSGMWTMDCSHQTGSNFTKAWLQVIPSQCTALAASS